MTGSRPGSPEHGLLGGGSPLMPEPADRRNAVTCDCRAAGQGQRLPAQLVQLDTAAAERCSVGTLRAVAAHAEREATAGAYVTEVEAVPALEAALAAWPLLRGDTVAVCPGEWGPTSPRSKAAVCETRPGGAPGMAVCRLKTRLKTCSERWRL